MGHPLRCLGIVNTTNRALALCRARGTRCANGWPSAAAPPRQRAPRCAPQPAPAPRAAFHPRPHTRPRRLYQAPRAADAAKAALAAGAAAVLLGGAPLPALANEFDILGEPTPVNTYYIDDAGVLSKSTKSAVNKKLRLLEVRPPACRGGGAGASARRLARRARQRP
jgi:hypothetical protein